MSEETVLDATLLSLLACPQDKGPLHYVHTEADAPILYNPRLRWAYRIDAGIPVLLIDEAREVDSAEHDQFLTQIEDSGSS